MPKARIRQTLRRLVWNTYIGELVGKSPCYCCRSKSITPFDFHCGHVVAEANGGPVHLDNLRPICAACNVSMGTMSMPDFMAAWTTTHDPMDWTPGEGHGT